MMCADVRYEPPAGAIQTLAVDSAAHLSCTSQGLQVEEKLVAHAEKQRTLSKNK